MIATQLPSADRQNLAEMLSTGSSPGVKDGDALLYFYQAHGLAQEAGILMTSANSHNVAVVRQLTQAWRMMRPPLADKHRPRSQISNAWRTVVKGFATGISPADLNSTLRMCFVLASESPFPPSSTSLKDLGEISQDEFQRLTLDATALLEQVLKSLPTCCRITDCPLVLRTLAEITTETEHVRAIPFEVRLYRPARAANLFMVIIMWLAPEFVSIPAACGLMRMAVLSKQSSLGMGDLHVASCFSVGLKRWTEKMWRSSSDDALLNTYVSCGVSFTDLIPEDLFGRPAWVCMYLKGQGLGCLQPAVFHQLQLKRWRPQMHSLSFMSTWPNNSDTGFIDEDEESRYLHELRCLLFTYRTPHGQPPERLPGINTFNHLAGLLKHVENCPADQCLAARHVIIENIKMEFALSSWPEPSEDQLGYMANSLMIMTDEKTHPPGHELILYTFDEEKVPWVYPKPAPAATEATFQPASPAAAPKRRRSKASRAPPMQAVTFASAPTKPETARTAYASPAGGGASLAGPKKTAAPTRQARHERSKASKLPFASASSDLGVAHSAYKPAGAERISLARPERTTAMCTQEGSNPQCTSELLEPNEDFDWRTWLQQGQDKRHDMRDHPARCKDPKPWEGPIIELRSDIDDVLSANSADPGMSPSQAEYEEAAKRVGQAAVALILQEERERVAAAKTSSAQMHVNSAKKVKGKKAAGKKAGGR
ncbi:hypothetical protein WJX74_005741 [Apatococcus lobatus]|uniref:Uncharacterized protein n=1 Tax=Apatococcus lobatus TaxID=904363 RepID=A0AAW1QD77_9CHLO